MQTPIRKTTARSPIWKIIASRMRVYACIPFQFSLRSQESVVLKLNMLTKDH